MSKVDLRVLLALAAGVLVGFALGRFSAGGRDSPPQVADSRPAAATTAASAVPPTPTIASATATATPEVVAQEPRAGAEPTAEGGSEAGTGAVPTTTPGAGEAGESEAAAAGEASTPAANSLPVTDPATLEVIARLNEWRLVDGLWPYSVNDELMALARQQAEYILSQPTFPDDVHRGPAGGYPPDRALAAGWPHYNTPQQIAITEIAFVGADAQAAVQWWNASSIHHDSVVNPAYREIGAAALEHPFGHLYVVVFGSRPDVLTALVEPETQRLYFSTENFRWARGGDWIQTVSGIQVLETAGETVDESAWLPWQFSINAPEAEPFYVVYTDGAHQTTVEVRPGVDVVWLPGNLPAVEGN